MRGGGTNLEWLKPLDPDGHRYRGRLGCHVGYSEFMNVRNPQPGFYYRFIQRNRGRIIETGRLGYKVVTADDPEYIGQVNDPNLQAAGILDTTYQGADTILVKCPDHLLRQRQEEKKQRAKAALEGGTADYLQGADPELQVRYSHGRPLRFRLPQHAIEETEGPPRGR